MYQCMLCVHVCVYIDIFLHVYIDITKVAFITEQTSFYMVLFNFIKLQTVSTASSFS